MEIKQELAQIQERGETIADIIREARDKYTVHNCNECNFRKSCDWNDWNFGSVECEAKRQSISLLLGIDDDYFNKLLTRLEAAHKRELIEVATRAATQGVKLTNEKYANMPIGNSAALREALKAAELGLFRWLSGSISRDEHRELVATIKTALAAPPRNCDRFGGDNAKLQKVYYSECGKEYEPRDPISRQAYFVGYGNWLLALAKKGGEK